MFLPVHLYMLSLLLTDPLRFDRFLIWTDLPLVKLSESVLIFLAAVHLLGGIRVIVYEWFCASPKQGPWIVASVMLSVVVGIIFLLSASL